MSGCQSTTFPSLIKSIYEKLASRITALCFIWVWTALLSLTVVVASFAPETAFLAAVSPSSAYSRMCGNGYARIPMELAAEGMCFRVDTVKRSGLDLFIPSIFAGLTVAGSALLLRSLDL